MKNEIYEDYTKILLKTFFKYSCFHETPSNTKNNKIADDDNNSNSKILKKSQNNNLINGTSRIFPFEIKEKCWNNAPTIKNRDPNRWRLDSLGNPVMKTLRGSQGIFCHEYDHIFPYSLGGTSTLDNCQILQTNINRKKGNQYFSKNELLNFKQKIPESLQRIGITKIDNKLLDIAEELIYGNINRY